MIELHRITKQISDLLEDQNTLNEIKRIMHHDGTISIIDQITHLQNNTQVNNINHLRKSLDTIEDRLECVNDDFTSAYNSVQDAVSYLEEVSDYSDYVDEAKQSVEDLKMELNNLTEDNQLDEVTKEIDEENTNNPQQ